MDILIRQQFGFPARLWAGHHDTADAAAAAAFVSAAVDEQAFVSVVGPTGSGKTTAVLRALAAAGARVVAPCRPDRQPLQMGDVTAAVVWDLSSETPRQSAERRARQARRILGGADRAVLLIDDAHELNASTLRGLKRLWEYVYRGRSPLAGIVLLGETDRTARVPSVDRRVSKLQLAGLDPVEAEAALRADCGHALDDGAVVSLASHGWARNWHGLGELVDEALREAAARGEQVVSASIALHALRRIDGGAVEREAMPVESGEGTDAAVDEALTRIEAAS